MQDRQIASNDEGLEGERAWRVLIVDLVGLRLGADGAPDHSEVRAHVEARGGAFHEAAFEGQALEKGRIHFFYQPHLGTEADILKAAGDGRYDAVIAAATAIPRDAVFPLAGVRIGAGTGNMGSVSWGGGNGEGGDAVLMNTPGVNSRATAQMVLKAVLKVLPELPVEELHRRVVAGDFDTGRDLKDYPAAKLEGRRFAVLGYGNIGREVARLARAFGMSVTVHARPPHRPWIEAEGFSYAETPEAAAAGADVLSVHVGLGRQDTGTGRYANAGIVGETVLSALRPGAVLVNYDRGEVVDTQALDRALASGRLRHAAIDADLFKNAASGALSGPLTPYIPLAERYPGRLELLPHAAADTDHPSRVAGACQAIDQIDELIRHRRAFNVKGDLPQGYTDAGATTPRGIGRLTASRLAASLADKRFTELHRLTKEIAGILDTLSSASHHGREQAAAVQEVAYLARSLLRHRTLVEELGLDGPAQEG